jgi:RNA polymerase sigma-54 factor
MNIKAGLYQQQTLKLTMTQELSQAIALLQYSAQELNAFLENKALENPLLSVEQPQTLSYQNTVERKKGKRLTKEKDSKYWIEQISGETKTLESQILSQLDISELSNDKKKIFLQLIRNLDDNGYLRISVSEAAEILGVEDEDVEECLFILHDLEPYGIGARSLQECLLIQAKNGHSDLAVTILGEEFLLFAEKKWKELSKRLGVSLYEIQETFDYIQTFNPRPASIFNNDKPAYITPDVTVELVEHELIISIMDKNSASITVNQSYLNRMKSSNDQTVNRFLQEKWQEYQWLAKGIQQRNETILNVMTQIVKRQPEYFKKGLSYLKPMTMREIAEELGIHESTVSRAVKDKYVQTSFGTIEMKSFFSSNLHSTVQDDVSSETAKREIGDVIKKEDKLRPLSDQDISEILKLKKGIILSRRTVAKYRDQLGIASSSKRKRYQ